MVDRLRPYYAWADKTADLYADAYRTAFVMAYFFAALAVAMALGPVALHLDSHSRGSVAFAVAEFLAISLILAIVARGWCVGWHRRWLDYRLLAEWIRHQRFAAILGGRRALPSVPEQWAGYGNPATSWMAWYARAVERSLGLPGAVVDPKYLKECLNDLERQLQGQVDFHKNACRRSAAIEHRLHLAEGVLLVLTLVCCGTHIVQGLKHEWLPWLDGHLLTFFCGVFPAFGAALAGINNQGEFKRVARRSESMRDQLALQVKAVKELQARLEKGDNGSQPFSEEVVDISISSAQAMVNEVLDWRVIFQDRPLKTA